MQFRNILFIVLALFTMQAQASGSVKYKVTVTNITKGQTFTPQLVTTHRRSVKLFTLGEAAGEAFEILAEAGNTGPLSDELNALTYKVGSVDTIPGLLGPGQSSSITIETRRHYRHLSFAAMLIPTNDTVAALNGVRLPRRGTRVYTVIAHDAGTEFNDQNCLNIPGPRCKGADHSPGPNDSDEGFVYVSNGFHDIGTEDAEGNEILGPDVYDWRNPVARVVITRVR